MIKHLTKHGNSLALVINRGVLELLRIKADTPLSLTTDSKCLVITPARDAKAGRVIPHGLEDCEQTVPSCAEASRGLTRCHCYSSTWKEVLENHHDQIKRYGGTEGIRDLGLLQSALAMPQAGSSTEYYQTDLLEMAAAYLFHIVKNHPFVDGNNRTGIAAALVFLEMNSIEVRPTNEALLDTVLAVVEGTLQKSGIVEFLRNHSRA